MSIETEPSSYATNDTTLLREVVASAETRLEAQLTASLAADQRALVLAGFLVAVIAALVSGAAALLLQTPPQRYLGFLAMFAAGGLFVSLALTVYTARPVKWGYPGTRPRAWIKDIIGQKDEHVRLAELAADAEQRARDNARLMATHGWCLIAALMIALLTILTSAAAMLRFFWCG